jgi:hypothetical protein
MEENNVIKSGKQTPKSANKTYQKPEILYLGELAVGRGLCNSGSSDINDCRSGVGATFACGAGGAALNHYDILVP